MLLYRSCIFLLTLVSWNIISCNAETCSGVENPCLNGASCYENDKGKVNCKCSELYDGPHCEKQKDACQPSRCIHGQCERNETSPGGFNCNCLKGYTGQFCEKSPICDPNPCLNGGSCTNDNGHYTCKCHSFYRGNNCEKQKDVCKPNRCANGQCEKDKESEFKCNCYKGYHGTLCEEAYPCNSNPCMNKGTCQNIDGGHSCDCTDIYTGQNCESQINPCNPNRCLNSGKCTVNTTDADEYTCKCDDKHYGVQCEKARPCSSNPCGKSGRCQVNETNIDEYICICDQKHTGKQCETKIVVPSEVDKKKTGNAATVAPTQPNPKKEEEPKPDTESGSSWTYIAIFIVVALVVVVLYLIRKHIPIPWIYGDNKKTKRPDPELYDKLASEDSEEPALFPKPSWRGGVRHKD